MHTIHSTDTLPQLGPARVHVLKSKWHGSHVDSLERKFREVMARAGTNDILTHTLSGSLEMPLAALDLTTVYPGIEAIVCFGVILKGDTAHFEMMLDTLSASFAKLTLDERVPIINCIIPAYSLKDVEARSGDDDRNKGIEAALATIETIRFRRALYEHAPHP